MTQKTEPSARAESPLKSPRYASVDALRGCSVAAMLLVNDPGDWGHVYWPLEHSPWNGCTPTDLIFPFFLFVVGVSVALGIEPRLERGVDPAKLQRAVLWRAARIVALGLLINVVGWLLFPFVAHLRLPGVLQRIGACFALTALLVLHTRPRTQVIVTAALLLGYALLLHSGGTLAPWMNIASRADSAVFASHVYQINARGQGHDPEGLLSTLGALVNCLLGVCAGRWLRQGRVRTISLAAVLWLLAGALWSLWQPFNKNLWTPSFALWSSGWAALALLLFHVLIDRHRWPALGRRFGRNAITAYALGDVLVFVLIGSGTMVPLYRHGFAASIDPLFGPWVASLAFAVAFVLVCYAVVWWMDRRGWYPSI